MAPLLEARRRPLVELDHQGPHRGQGRPERLFVELAETAAGAGGEVVMRLPVQLGLAGPDQVHGARDRAHDPADVGEGDVQHLFERKRRVDRGRQRQQQVGAVPGAGLIGKRGLHVARSPAKAHQGQGQQHEGGDQQD